MLGKNAYRGSNFCETKPTLYRNSMEPRRCHAGNNYANPCAYGLLSHAHRLLNRAHDLVIRVHDLVIRAHDLVIRAHDLVSRAHGLALLLSRAHGLARLNNYFPHGTAGAPYNSYWYVICVAINHITHNH